MTPPERLALQFSKSQFKIFVLFPIIYNAPPFVSTEVQLSNTVSITLTLFPVINKAPPSTTAELCVKLDLDIVTFEPVRQMVPPLELDLVLSIGSISLIPLLFKQVML